MHFPSFIRCGSFVGRILQLHLPLNITILLLLLLLLLLLSHWRRSCEANAGLPINNGVTGLESYTFLSTEPLVVGCVNKPKVLVTMEVDYLVITPSNPVNRMAQRYDFIIRQCYVNRNCMNGHDSKHTIRIINTLAFGYRVFPGAEAAGAWCWPPTPSKCRGHERVGLYLYSPSGPSWPVIGRTFTFTFGCVFINLL